MNPKLSRRIKYALNYLESMSYRDKNGKLHYRHDYNQQIILDVIELINDSTKIINIKSYAATCPRCKKSVDYDYIQNGGILPSLDYDLIGDDIFHAECWNMIVNELPLS